jgi:hypothetical protein
VGLKSAAFKGDFPKPEVMLATTAPLRDHAAEALLDQSPEGRALLPGDAAGVLEEAIGNLYGCLHMASHIIISRRLSMALDPTRRSSGFTD